MTEHAPQPPLPAGWYPHEASPGAVVYWDGKVWGQPMAAPGAIQPPIAYRPSKVSDALVVAGFVTMILIPIVGFAIGIIVAAKGKAGYGVVILVVSVLSALYWINEFSATSAP